MRPKCLNCNEFLEVDDTEDVEIFSCDETYITFLGECPLCNRRYKWIEKYIFNDFNNLKEI